MPSNLNFAILRGSGSRIRAVFFLFGVLAFAGAVQAQAVAPAQPENQVQLSASATIEVPQDWLALTLQTSRDGPDASTVQTQLKQALDAALTQVRKLAQPGQMEVRSGNFSLYPRHGKDGRINGWLGRSELVLEGRDFALIGATAGRIQSLNVGGLQFSLSRERRSQVEAQAQTQAIEAFKARAGQIARGFGFTTFGLREIAVNANDQGFAPRTRVMAMEATTASADAPVPLEAGKTAVVVTVSGSVQLK